MNEQITKYIQPVIQFWKNMPKKRRTTILAAVGGLVVVSFVLVLLLNIQPYTVLYSGLDNDESVQIVQLLQEGGYTCKVEDGGTIMVPKDQVDKIRMDLATQGYPKSALNYDVFTSNIDMMTTDYEKRQLLIYQLQERLQTTIETMDAVDSAIVTISIPEDGGYAWEDNSNQSSASVMVDVVGGATLSGTQVNGIKQLVAKSVPGLDTSEVAVVDTSGNELQSSEDTTQMDLTELGMVIKSEFEQDINEKVSNVLTPIFGSGNYAISVSGIVNLDKMIEEIITYTPSDTKNNTGVLSEGSSDTEIERNNGGTGGTTGTDSNSDLTTYSGVTLDGNTVYIKDNKTYTYLVSQVTQQIEHNAAVLDQMYVAVTVNLETMDDADKSEIQQLVATAAATDAANVFVYNSKFNGTVNTGGNDNNNGGTTDNTQKWTTQQIIIAGGALGGLLLVIMIIVIIMAKRRKKHAAEEDGEEDAEEDYLTGAQEEMSVEDKIDVIKDSRQQKMKDVIQDFSTKNPEIAAQLIRSWLKEEGDSNG
ncbi:MAG: flagellar basal-body MS-ring/collar protein FliF [Anaerofustis sp.]